uniref:DUF148 domain-containing protein n=1 Tax=Elaeophora elaphi TaxID=1147741 RepID=A0A0R3RK27_9BILA
MEMKMNGNCVKILLLFAMTYSSLGSKEWMEDEYPQNMPQSQGARKEYYSLYSDLDLSTNELNHPLGQWDEKYNILNQYEKDHEKEREYKNMFYQIFSNKLESISVSKPIKKAISEISELIADMNTLAKLLRNQINQVINKLPVNIRPELNGLWTKLEKETINELEYILENGNTIDEMRVIPHPLLGMTCGFWLEDDLPSFIKELDTAAQEEYCDIFEDLKLSRTQLNDKISVWAEKHNVLVNIDLLELIKTIYLNIYKILLELPEEKRGEIIRLWLMISEEVFTSDAFIEQLGSIDPGAGIGFGTSTTIGEADVGMGFWLEDEMEYQ